MDELKKLDELRKEAKDYANTIVLPNNERLENNNESNEERQKELLQKRDEQEAKWKEEMAQNIQNDGEPIVLHSNERLDETKELEDRKNELLRMRDEQEARWSKKDETTQINENSNLIGKINKNAKSKLTNLSESVQKLLTSLNKPKENDTYLEEYARNIEEQEKIMEANEAALEADKVLSQKVDLERNNLISYFPNAAVAQIADENLFALEKDTTVLSNGQSRTLKKHNGSVFSSILLVMTALTVGVIAAIMIIK